MEIEDLAAQRQALAEPERVRPAGGCRACGTGRLHVHSRRERKLVGHGEAASILVLVFRCARAQCRATWRVLPKFLARHLWRAWSTVAEAVIDEAKRSPVPRRTRQRWWARLRERAAVLVAVLGASGDAKLVTRATTLGSDAQRGEVLAAFGGPSALPMLAALIHHLMPSVRVM